MAFTKFYPKKTYPYGIQEDVIWTPPVDVVEEKEKYIVELDIPGLEKDAFKLSVNDNVLYVSGERKSEETKESDLYSYYERVKGKFERSFRLPNEINSGKIVASYKNGVLRLELPKKEEAKPQLINITD